MASEKGENLSNSTSSCERVLASILCCKCQTNHDASDHEHQHEHKHKDVNSARDQAVTRSDLQAKKPLDLPAKAASHAAGSGEAKGPALAKSDTFSEYIHRAKMKIRTMSNVGHGKSASEADDVQVHEKSKEHSSRDGFSDYITRAKMKIRKTSSSVGTRKSHSIRRE